jgi:hypothetical protein
LREKAIDDDHLRRTLLERVADRVERAFGRGDQQPEHQRGQRREQPGDELHGVLRFAAEMVPRQKALQSEPEQRSAVDT